MSSRRLLSGADRHRGRQGTASSSRSQHAQPAKLPEYEPPSFPLDNNARKALADLSTNRDSQKYAEHIQKSLKLLSDSVRDINDKYTARKDYVKERQEKRGEGAQKNDRDRAEEKAALALKEEVPQLTDECESAVRSVIDLKVELEDSKSAWRETLRKVEAESANAPARGSQNDESNEDDEAADVPHPPVTGSLKLLQEAKKKLANDYATKTMYERYALDNDYIGFKRIAHDAIYSTEGKPLPDPSRWFTQNGSRVEEEEDEDLVISEVNINIHCPISMAVMEDPYTSRKCKHTFDKSSIMQLFGRGAKKPCPQTGCREKELTVDDFDPDPVMLRKIKRILARQAQSDVDDDEDEDDADGDGGVDEDGDASMRVTEQRSVKSERGRARGRELLEAIEDS